MFDHQWIPLTKGPLIWHVDDFFIVNLNKRLNIELSCQWFQMLWCSCNITVMLEPKMTIIRHTTYIILRGNNLLALGRYGNNLKKYNFQTHVMDLIHEHFLWNCSQVNAMITFNDKSTLVHVTAWCCQAASHCLSQCWPKYMSPYGSLGHNGITFYSTWLQAASPTMQPTKMAWQKTVTLTQYRLECMWWRPIAWWTSYKRALRVWMICMRFYQEYRWRHRTSSGTGYVNHHRTTT